MRFAHNYLSAKFLEALFDSCFILILIKCNVLIVICQSSAAKLANVLAKTVHLQQAFFHRLDAISIFYEMPCKTSHPYMKTLLQQFGSNTLWPVVTEESEQRVHSPQCSPRRDKSGSGLSTIFCRLKAAKKLLSLCQALAVWLTSFKRSRKLTGEMEMNRSQLHFPHGQSNTI